MSLLHNFLDENRKQRVWNFQDIIAKMKITRYATNISARIRIVRDKQPEWWYCVVNTGDAYTFRYVRVPARE
jgi:hypothetical protein